jgi:hypothetical protein
MSGPGAAPLAGRSPAAPGRGEACPPLPLSARYTTVHNLRHGIIRAPRQLVAAAWEFHWAVPVTWYALIGMLIATRFWTLWQALLS